MLVIRLARGGRSKYPTYRIVAAEKRFAATGRFVEVLGRYNPHSKELVLDKAAVQRRVDNGAQPSNSVLKLMVREGMELPKWASIATKARNPKKEVEVTEADAAAEVQEDVVTDEATAEKATPEAEVEAEAVAEAPVAAE
ncbi:MAG: 30S ribosomal protein S16 [bacterium]